MVVDQWIRQNRRRFQPPYSGLIASHQPHPLLPSQDCVEARLNCIYLLKLTKNLIFHIREVYKRAHKFTIFRTKTPTIAQLEFR